MQTFKKNGVIILLTHDKNTQIRDGNVVVLPLAANIQVYAGAIGVINSEGYATKGYSAIGLKAVGRIEHYADNRNGEMGSLSVIIKRGTFKYKNSAIDPVLQKNLFEDCYIEDDETVAGTAGNPATKSKAGKVLGIDSDGVWVEIR